MDEGHSQLRLSDEAIALFFEKGGFGDANPVDLRSLWKSEHSEAVNRAATTWNVRADRIVVSGSRQRPSGPNGSKRGVRCR